MNFIGILTARSLEPRGQGRRFLELLCGSFPMLTPERYGYYEPLKDKFDPRSIEETLDAWSHGDFLWNRSRPGVDGHVIAGNPDVHDGIYIDLADNDHQCLMTLLLFMQVAVVHFDGDYAYLLTDEEIQRSGREMLDPFLPCLTTWQLLEGLPNPTWATVYGAPYVRMFGRERILSVPAPIVRELADNVIYVQLTENVATLSKEYAQLEQTRDLIKEHLDMNAFLDPYEAARHRINETTDINELLEPKLPGFPKCNVPDFSLETRKVAD